MQRKTKRPDFRIEPLLMQRLQEYCVSQQISVSSYIYALIVNDLKQAQAISDDDFRVIRGVGSDV